MFITWEEAKRKFPDNWVVFKNPQYKDAYQMELIGGEFVLTAKSQKEMFDAMPDEGCYTGRHTREDEAVGLLKSGF